MAEITVESDLSVDYRDVTGVLLADGWHRVVGGSFTIGWPRISDWPTPTNSVWFGFDEPYRVPSTAIVSGYGDTRRVVGPATSILALRS